MSTLLILRGLPASGKTTFAKQWVAEDVEHRSRVNRDELRETLHDGFQAPNEQTVSRAEYAVIVSLLAAKRSVVVDNTNLRKRYVRKYMELAAQAGADIEFKDFEVPISEAVTRDHYRMVIGERGVGEDVIRQMADRFNIKEQGVLPARPELDEEFAVEPYVPDPSLPLALQVDIDGTVALHNGRSPYDYSRVSEDLPNENVIQLIQAVWASDWFDWIIFLSGRPETCIEDTERWLSRYFDPAEFKLFMRPADQLETNDSVVKVELFNKYVRNNYNVVAVLDDRNRVVRAWRKLGLTCLQVAEGAF